MSLEVNEATAITDIQDWFADRCDGIWEHRLGISIESTDNPGWLLTFKEMNLSKNVLAEIVGNLLLEYDAQVLSDGCSVRVFSTTLKNCILAGAMLVRREKEVR